VLFEGGIAVRRMLAAVLVLGTILGFGLLVSQAQVEPVAPIGPNEKPIAQTKTTPTGIPEIPRLDPVEKPKGIPPIEGLPSLAPPPMGPMTMTPPTEVLIPALDAPPPAIKLEPRSEGTTEPKIPGPLSLPKEEPKKPVPVVENEIKIPPPERAFPLNKLPETPPALKSEEPKPLPKPEVKPEPPKVEPTPKIEVKPEVKPEIKPEVKVEPKPETVEKQTPATPAKGIAPSLSVEIRAPETVGINQPLDYEMVIKNVGPVTVQQVRLEDELPKSTKYLGGEPVAEVQGEKMVWNLGTLEVNAERKVKVTLKPSAEGDWRSKPVVTFSATVLPVQVTITRPKIEVAIKTPSDTAYLGEEVPFDIEIKNTGNGIAERVTVRAQLSDGLFHPQAVEAHNRVIEAELAKLGAGESRSVSLKLKVMKVGSQGCILSASAEGSPEATTRSTVQAVPPALTLKINGPQRGLVRAEPTFNLEVVNTEKTPLNPVQIAAALPEGLEYVSATEGATYDAEKRVLNWNLGTMQPGQKRSVTLKTRANTVGNWAIRSVAHAGPRQEVKAEWVIQTEGVPGLNFEITSKENPTEVGKEATYEIRIVNQGTSACTNIRLAAAMSDGMSPTTATLGDTVLPFKMNGQTLIFDAIPKLAGQGELSIRLKARGSQSGDQRCKVQISCDQLKQPIVKEESTYFFMQ
jgi:uncharacterized repeat protein (TIGR01451 family)